MKSLEDILGESKKKMLECPEELPEESSVESPGGFPGGMERLYTGGEF